MPLLLLLLLVLLVLLLLARAYCLQTPPACTLLQRGRHPTAKTLLLLRLLS